tara:strand:+ start:1800 stop:2384 length:585 start_codon:yes stop_codon:yes gene_type:complete
MVAEAAGVSYNKSLVNLRNVEQKGEEYLKINPMGKVPAMVDGDVVLTESIAIQRYIARKSKSDLYPSTVKEQAVVDRWTDLIAHEVRTPILDIEVYRWVRQMSGAEVNEGVVEVCYFRLDRALPVLEAHLEKNAFLNGSHMTIADISLVASLDPVDVVGIDMSKYPKLRSILDTGRKSAWYQAVNSHFGAEFGL